MGIKRHKPEEIVTKLRQVEVPLRVALVYAAANHPRRLSQLLGKDLNHLHTKAIHSETTRKYVASQLLEEAKKKVVLILCSKQFTVGGHPELS
jgi:uncharacterized membrane-anchored protein YjiN (DUF445 family)